MENLMLLSQIKQKEALKLRFQGFGEALAFLCRGDGDKNIQRISGRRKRNVALMANSQG